MPTRTGAAPLLRPARVRPRALGAAAALSRRLGVDLDPGRPARGLSVADRPRVETAEALSPVF